MPESKLGWQIWTRQLKPSNWLPMLRATPTTSGSDVVIDFGSDMLFDEHFVIDGVTRYTPHLPIALGPSFLNASPIVAEAQDVDSNGIVDLVEGTFELTGPGMELYDIAFEITQVTQDPDVCVPGSEGPAAPTVGVRVTQNGRGTLDGNDLYSNAFDALDTDRRGTRGMPGVVTLYTHPLQGAVTVECPV